MTQAHPALQESASASGPARVPVSPGRKPQPPFVEFGRYLRARRLRAGFSSQRAALRAPNERGVRISQALLAHYESGRVRDPSPLVLSTLASIYGCGLQEMLLRLARAKFRSVRAEETPLDRARWELVDSTLDRRGAIGSGT
ncbi:MAG TPA: helix-turn-helix transcriptional regulator, partial [Planctomycetota bacterium]|nr:helix-turn-helix transcriptional regulator [Planctomycetota bacterium]